MRWRHLAATAAAILAATSLALPAEAANPIVTGIYTADPATLVHDGRMYVYTGHDEAAPGQDAFVMRDWRVYSSADPSDDPAAWTDHGSRLSLSTFAWAGANAWASEVIAGPDGRFYWFVSVDGNGPGWMNIGVAVGNTPLGPFTDAIGGPLVSDATPNSSALNIDPTVFTDNGSTYLYWGSYWQPRVVELSAGLTSLAGPVTTPTGLTGFWEAPWLFKRGSTYYMAYASNSGTDCVTSSSYACVRYATAANVLGPWTERGVILGQVSSTTSHPAIEEFGGRWWMVYHTADAPGGGNFRRSIAIDRLHFEADGSIRKVITTPGPGNPDPANVATSATASASYTSPWESVAAVNDGRHPASSGDASAARWGTWPQTGPQWIQLDWAQPVRVDGSQMYFFQDVPADYDGGVKAPAAWRIQYWTGSAWADPPGASGYGTALDAYNTTTFTPVTTTRLRALLTPQAFSGSGGVGVLEWRVRPQTPTTPLAPAR